MAQAVPSRFSWGATWTVVGVLVGLGVSFIGMAPPEFWIGRVLLGLAGGLLATRILMAAVDHPGARRPLVILAIVFALAVFHEAGWKEVRPRFLIFDHDGQGLWVMTNNWDYPPAAATAVVAALTAIGIVPNRLIAPIADGAVDLYVGMQ